MKFYMNEWEQEALKKYHPDLYEKMKDQIELYVPDERTERLREINKQMEDKLGALGIEYGNRVAAYSEVPGLPHLGARPNYVVFDESHNLSEVYESGDKDVTAQRWMEHRRVCRRTLLDCLSGETC